MEQQMITRRKAFAAAGVAAGALGATAALTGVRSVQAASGAEGDAVVGTWDVTVTSAVSGQPPSTSLVASRRRTTKRTRGRVSSCLGVAAHGAGHCDDPGDDRRGHDEEKDDVRPDHGDHAVNPTSLRVRSRGARDAAAARATIASFSPLAVW